VRRWTALQYRFLARNPGRIELNPFEILVNGTSALSPAFSVTVRPPEVRSPTAPRQEVLRLFWRDLPAALTVGEEARLVLCAGSQSRPGELLRAGDYIPAAGLPLPPVPPMAIMEAGPLRGEDEVLALRVIPLEGPSFILPGFSVSLGTQSLQAPALRIPVSEAKEADGGEQKEGPAPKNFGEAAAKEPAPAAVTPSSGGGSPPPLPPGLRDTAQGLGSNIQERVQDLWEEGQTVEALVELRRNERDHPLGFTLVKPRRELEAALGLEPSADEIWRPRPLLIPGMIFCLLLAALSLTLPVLLRRPIRFIPGWFFKVLSVVFTVIALFCLFRLIPLLSYRGGDAPRQALARETTVYKVPDSQATGITRFRAGQGILVYEARDGWAYAESVQTDRGAGWIRAGAYLVY
jgi:hypothetical protein